MKMQQGETDPIHTITDYNSELSLLQIKPKKSFKIHPNRNQILI
jgi:hypothetical protein